MPVNVPEFISSFYFFYFFCYMDRIGDRWERLCVWGGGGGGGGTDLNILSSIILGKITK